MKWHVWKPILEWDTHTYGASHIIKSRVHKNRQLKYKHVTPIEARSLVKIIEPKNRTAGYVSTRSCAVHATIFSSGGNSDRF